MKKLKFLAFGLMCLMFQGVSAVTLPSTSYNPYAGASEYSSSEGTIIGSGTMITGSYSALGSGESDYFTDCINSTPKSSEERFACCTQSVIDCYNGGGDEDECNSQSLSCPDADPLGTPLNGGEIILMALAICTVAFKVLKVKNSNRNA